VYIGFGLGTTWYYAKGSDRFGPFLPACVEITKKAIAAGYRKLDGAEMYGTEAELGAAMKESGLPREEFFVCTKVHQGMSDIPRMLDTSLKNMQTDYVDLSVDLRRTLNKSVADSQPGSSCTILTLPRRRRTSRTTGGRWRNYSFPVKPRPSACPTLTARTSR
jgi:hypothetical protein